VLIKRVRLRAIDACFAHSQNVNDDMLVMQEEIFGSIIPVMTILM